MTNPHFGVFYKQLLFFTLFTTFASASAISTAKQQVEHTAKEPAEVLLVNRTNANKIFCSISGQAAHVCQEKNKHYRLTQNHLLVKPRFSSRSDKKSRNVVFSFQGMKIQTGKNLTIQFHPGDLESKRRWIGLKVGDYEIRLKSHTVMLLGDRKNDDRKVGIGGFLLPPKIFKEELKTQVSVDGNRIELRLLSNAVKDQVLTCSWNVKKSLSEKNPWDFGFAVFNGNGKIPAIQVSSVQVGSKPLVGKHRQMPKHPLTDVTKDGIGVGKSGRKGLSSAAINNLVMDLNSPVSKSELDAAIDHVLKTTLPGIKSHRLSFFGQRRECSSIGWLYRRTKDQRLVDGMIDSCMGVLSHRNDNYQKTGMRIGNPKTGKKDFVIAPNWEHLRKAVWDIDSDEVTVEYGIGSFGGQAWPIMTARMISESPDLWNKHYKGKVKQFQGKTYRQVGLVMLAHGRVTIDFLFKYYLDSRDMLLKSPSGVEEPEGVYPQWNRIFPAVVANANYVVACRNLNVEKEFSEKVRQTIIASMKLFESRLRTHHRGGKKVYSYSYGSTSMTQCEDTGHGSFEHSELGWLFDEGYYKQEHAIVFGDTVESLYLGDRKFCARFVASDSIPKDQKGKKLYEKGIGYIWMTRFNPNLREIICTDAVKNGKGLYAYCQMLKLRDHFSGYGKSQK